MTPSADGHLGIQPRSYEWTVSDYYKAADAGLFEGRHVQLIQGEIVEIAPMGSMHATAIQLVMQSLSLIFQQGFVVRTQLPLNFSSKSEPEPDISVVKGTTRDYATAHPHSAVLIVEIADSTLNFDRNLKSRLYAEFGVEDYWIVNLRRRCVEVHRSPVNDLELGWVYSETRSYGENESISPIAAPESSIAVSDILP